MKKILTVLLVMFLLVMNVEADDRLNFDNEDGSLYYSAESKDNVFLTYDDMTPGKEYTDTLRVKNESDNTYDLYLRINSYDQAFLEDELIENIVMMIYSDGKLVYDGEANATEYDENGLLYQELIELGNFKPNEVKEVVVKLKILEDYNNASNLDTGKIEWQFYAGYEDGVQPYLPKPNGEMSNRTILLVVVAIFVSLILVLVYRNKYGMKKKDMKKRSEL